MADVRDERQCGGVATCRQAGVGRHGELNETGSEGLGNGECDGGSSKLRLRATRATVPAEATAGGLRGLRGPEAKNLVAAFFVPSELHVFASGIRSRSLGGA